MSAHFDFLTGVVAVDSAMPPELAGDLTPFFTAPNDPRWRNALSRVLYHETLHFWQLLSSGYLANIAGEEWRRMKLFEGSDSIPPLGKMTADLRKSPEGFPFDAFQLMECWARYWDVHTGGAVGRLVREEGLEDEAGDQTVSIEPYEGRVFDRLMLTGPGSNYYGAAYQWMFDITDGDSRFVVLAFPILVYAAFQTPDPVRIFCLAFEHAWRSDFIRQESRTNRAGLVNIDWCVHWGGPLRNAVEQAKSELRDSRFSSGFDVIQRGLLADHPAYMHYLSHSLVLNGHIKLLPDSDDWPPTRMQDVFRRMTKKLPVEPIERDGLLDPLTVFNAKADHWIVFGLPGQPTFRYLLGRTLPPPRVRFSDGVYDPDYPALMKLQCVAEAVSPEEYSSVMDRLESRAKTFRAAEVAVRYGLPPNAFRRQGGN